MAKKIVRGITDVKTINNQDYDTNNVNDLLSDGQYNYIHRKKGETEEYHNLTDNIKTISSDNTELLAVTNNNKTTNTATLHPKHDSQKEQVLESTRNTVTINHGTNGTAEKTTVDTNPKKVLEHENLISSSQYVTIEHVEDSNTSEIKTDELNNTINELNSKITSVEGKIPTEIGAKNLIIKSTAKIGFRLSADAGELQDQAHSVSDWIKVKPNTTYTLTTYEDVNEGSMYYSLAWYSTNNADYSGWISRPTGTATSADLKGGRQYKSPANAKYAKVSYPTKYAKFKLERGKISTDYTPAPEDIQRQKEQVLESTRDTIAINHGTNGTAEKTTVDTNPQKVLEHEKLKTGDGLTTSFNTDETTIMFKATKKTPETNLNTLGEGVMRGKGFSIDQVPNGNQDHSAAYVTINTSDSIKVQFYIRESGPGDGKIRLYYRFIKDGKDGVVTEWKQMVGDSGDLNNQLTQKQDKLTAMDGISITGDSIYLTSLNDYSEDLNNLTYTCTAKPIDNTPNLPTGVGGNGVLSVIRVGNVVSQTYHALDNNVYYRITNNSSTTFVWTPWVKVTTTAV